MLTKHVFSKNLQPNLTSLVGLFLTGESPPRPPTNPPDRNALLAHWLISVERIL